MIAILEDSAIGTASLILGGARSGKSRYAQNLAEGSGLKCVFIATAEPLDGEMADRIARHQTDRGPAWTTKEVPLDLPEAIRDTGSSDAVLLVDCLTLWLSNLMHHDRDVEASTSDLCEAITSAQGMLILVSNEIGLGLVPETPLGRSFRDAQGRLNQQIAAVCDRVEFMAAGLPLTLKG